ncbi:hypothetical protein PFICI_15204 [Pestalotiopsis fici W106-1]|uniref:Alpha/beta hydrolase fold-3 domain-containing protein n=1 Tax=Pestalotiopsis fici (strain W106-1 / CGMCC3.15140) TaxID=1229662 RepID=W3WGV3_PESFW|nr:uncharacterized protein PFICI_15204 [Pestalotiopsis fici W106-1]ETS73029.1 hypothetical protein PFICI_15204 [Pestalotiopsis fici W106-1]
MSPLPLDTYSAWIDKKRAAAIKEGDRLALDRLSHMAEHLPDGNSWLLWVGNRKKASRYVLFFPGGGYIAPVTPGHFEWCFRAYVERESGHEVAVAVLQYTLCPAARYPTQLMQATSALRHLMDSGIPASSIVIGGDSAGGNLTAQLLIHLAHSAAPNRLPEPLAGAFLVSPWLSGNTNGRSFSENQFIDMLSREHIETSSRELLHTQPTQDDLKGGHGEWALPLDTDRKWLNGLAQTTRALYVTVGANEVLRDQGILFAETIRKRNETINVQLEILEADAHDSVLLEGFGALLAIGKKEYDLPPQLARHRAEIASYFSS